MHKYLLHLPHTFLQLSRTQQILGSKEKEPVSSKYTIPNTKLTLSQIPRKWMQMDECGWKRMKADENGWKWMKVDENIRVATCCLLSCGSWNYKVQSKNENEKAENVRTSGVVYSHSKKSLNVSWMYILLIDSQCPLHIFKWVLTSGGTLLWDNRRLIGRSLIVLARKVQNNRD